MIFFTLRVINQIVLGTLSKPVVTPKKTVDIAYRCWPVDIDAFFHMNNSRYLSCAELSRWRCLAPTSFFSRVTSKEGILFLAVENHIQYIRPIQPFQKFVISTSCSVDEKEDKWILYRHSFQQHPDDIKEGFPAKEFAVVDLKAVVKEANGRTIKPSVLMEESKFLKDWMQKV